MASKKDSEVEKSVDLAQEVNIGKPVNGEDVGEDVGDSCCYEGPSLGRKSGRW